MEKIQDKKIQATQSLLRSTGAGRPFLGSDDRSYIAVYKGPNTVEGRLVIDNYQKVRLADNAAALRFEEWRTLDEAVLKIAEQRLVGFEDLRRNGLVFSLPNAMASTVLTWDEMSDAMVAEQSLDPVRRANNDQVVFQQGSIPLPVTHADYQIGERILQESRSRGQGLDVLNAERATRAVTVVLEDSLFGATASFASSKGGTLNTYLTHPNRNLLTLATPWDTSGFTGVSIKNDVLDMIAAARADFYFGPYILYVPAAYETVLDDDYDVSGASLMTTRERLLKIDQLQEINVVDRLPADNIILVTMQKEVVDFVDGLPMQNIQWDSDGGMVHHFKVMTIMVPRIRADFNDRSGIVHLS